MLIEQPHGLIRRLFPEALWRMDPERRSVYLTFDDGPIPEATPYLLDVLESMDVRATFFMVGDNARKFPQLLTEVRSRGHRIGNHSFNHIGGMSRSTDKYMENVLKAEEILHSDKLFRPPHGWMTWGQYRAMREDGWRVVMWDVLTRDYNGTFSADMIMQNVRRHTRNGSIITFHDSLKSIDRLHGTLPNILTWLKQQGYEFDVFD